MTTTMCSTRGMSFDPQQARIDRLRLKAEKIQAEAEAEKQRAREIRESYHEYSPAQIKQAGAMIHTCAKAVKRVETEDFLMEIEDIFPGSVPSLQRPPVCSTPGMPVCGQPDCSVCGRKRARKTERQENLVRVELEACDPKATPRLIAGNRGGRHWGQ